MEGAALAAKRQFDLGIYVAWHTAVFALNGYQGKLRGLSTYTSREEPDSAALNDARAIAFFRNLKAGGVPIEITRH